VVKGLEIFREHFRNFADRYVLIGGAACDIAMTAAGLAFQSYEGSRYRSLRRGFGRRFCPGILGVRARRRLRNPGEVNWREAVLPLSEAQEPGLSFYAGVILTSARCTAGSPRQSSHTATA
jgi:hypothetical protein